MMSSSLSPVSLPFGQEPMWSCRWSLARSVTGSDPQHLIHRIAAGGPADHPFRRAHRAARELRTDHTKFIGHPVRGKILARWSLYRAQFPLGMPAGTAENFLKVRRGATASVKFARHFKNMLVRLEPVAAQRFFEDFLESKMLVTLIKHIKKTCYFSLDIF